MLYRHCYDAELRVWGSKDGVFLCLKELSTAADEAMLPPHQG